MKNILIAVSLVFLLVGCESLGKIDATNAKARLHEVKVKLDAAKARLHELNEKICSEENEHIRSVLIREVQKLPVPGAALYPDGGVCAIRGNIVELLEDLDKENKETAKK